MRDLALRQMQILRLLAFGMTNRRIPQEPNSSANCNAEAVLVSAEEVVNR